MSASDCPVTEMPDVLRAALECADDGIVIVDGAHRITHFNAGAERIWKLARADVLGRDAEILSLRCLQADPVADFRDEISLVRRDGSRIKATIALSSATIDGATHHIVFARDVTADAERRVRIGLLNAVSDQTNRVVIITDVEQNIRYVNSSFTTLFGYTSEEAEGRRAGELIAGCHTDRNAVAKLVKRLMMAAGVARSRRWSTPRTARRSGSAPGSTPSATRRAASSTSSRCSRTSPNPGSCARSSSSS